MIPRLQFLQALAATCLVVSTTIARATSNFIEDSDDSSQQVQQGSWSHWWSYDGISGPDYWNINKHWRLCSLGRKQSPVNIRTDRLLFDHLLGPLRLEWQPTARHQLEQQQQQQQLRSRDDQEHADLNQAHKPKKTIPVKLINSGRGIEAWLERGAYAGDSQASKLATQRSGSPSTATSNDHEVVEQLVLARGPLSYHYKLFKMELHSSPSYVGAASSSATTSSSMTNRPDVLHTDEQEDEQQEVQPPGSSEHLIDGRSFEAELQLHFYNAHLASSAREALRQADEAPPASLFAVISVFISLQPQPQPQQLSKPASQPAEVPPTAANHQTLAFLLDNLGRLQNQGDSLEVKVARQELDLLITDPKQYVTYQGSMNRPPCAESVDWILLNKALRVDAAKFGQLFERINTNQENIRPVRQLNGRLLRTTISNLAVRRTACDPHQCQPDRRAKGGGQTAETNNNCDNLQANSNASRPMASNQGDTWTRQQWCSMKPRYAYEFTYGHASTKSIRV